MCVLEFQGATQNLNNSMPMTTPTIICEAKGKLWIIEVPVVIDLPRETSSCIGGQAFSHNLNAGSAKVSYKNPAFWV
jgi:hypothetical protein